MLVSNKRENDKNLLVSLNERLMCSLQDWLLSILQYLPEQHLEAAIEAAWLLHGARVQLEGWLQKETEEQERILNARDTALQSLSHLSLHRQVPMALGSGNKSVEMLISAIARKLQLESEFAVGNIMGRVVGVCADLAEVGLPDFASTVAAVYPSWQWQGPVLSCLSSMHRKDADMCI